MQARHFTAAGQVPQIAFAGKVMATVFWDGKGVLMIDYLEREKTVTRVYYAARSGNFVQLSNKNAGESCVTVCFFIMTMRLPTCLLLPWLQFESAASSC